ncbi:discoidin domain-containing protein [Flavihumibacter rivuli]|uniref:galactose-binding domain-containing protein n=1 Tax=Flavihumibacter rivuli TaxID=2838156 RepID=UPI001BDF1BB3|nr:discoidin domain-containing protein [Flavihumibacter rivuli]ULQ55770.1 discoidin domain-containing protein [Flavihumibacter rivuli]
MRKVLLLALLPLIWLAACQKEKGASPYDPGTPVSVSLIPKVKSFSPSTGKTGDTILINGFNFKEASKVMFGNKPAASYSILSDELIKAVVGDGASGQVSVANAKGARPLAGFEYIPPAPPIENANMALNKPATSSGGGNAEKLANDGELSTRWFSAVADNQWWKVDMGSIRSISRVDIKWEGAFAVDYSIQVSTDDIAYTTVYSTTSGSGGDVSHRFNPKDARYVKLVLNKRGTIYSFSFWEVEVYK